MNKHVIVVGAGNIGYHLAKNLAYMNIPVKLIDNKINIEENDNIRYNENIEIIKKDAKSYEALNMADVANAKLIFLALREDSETIMVSLIAKSINPSIISIARIRNKNLLDAKYLYKDKILPIDIPIYPEKIVAKHVLDLVKYKNTREVMYFINNKVILRSIKIYKYSKLIGKTIIEIKQMFKGINFIVASISREGEQGTIIPNGHTKIKLFDTIHVFILDKDEEYILDKLGYEKNKIKNAILVGGGTYGKIIAKELSEHKIACTLIESDKNKAKKLDEELLKTIILHGDGKDEELLQNNKISKIDLLIAATSDGFSNIIISNISKSLGAKNTVSLTFNRSLHDLSYSLGVDVCLNPRYPAISEVLSNIYSDNIKFNIIGNEDAEIIEITVKKEIPILDKQFKEIDFKGGVLIALIQREEELIIPSGEDSVKLNDKIFVFVLKKEVNRVLNNFFKEYI